MIFSSRPFYSLQIRTRGSEPVVIQLLISSSYKEREKVNRLKRLLILLAILGVVACSSADGELEVKEVWGRSSPMAAQNGAFYMQIVNNTSEDEQLLEVRTDVCQTVELHETYMKENDVMGMRPVATGVIEIPADETTELKTGGLHVMCLGKTAEFNVGDAYELTIVFASAGEIEMTADIRESEEMSGMDMDMDMEGENDMEMESGDGG